MALAEDFDGVEIMPAHRYSEMNRQWYWGWVAVDRADDLAIGIVTTYRIAYYTIDSTPVPPYAGVMIVHARRHRGLGVHLLLSARNALAALHPPVTLYRSGVGTPQGQQACLDAGLDLDPMKAAHIAKELKRGKPVPHQPYTQADALDLGRRHLEAAAQRLGVEPIPPK